MIQAKELEKILGNSSIENTGWHLGACHYTINKRLAIRLVDTGWCGLVTNKPIWDEILEIKSVPHFKSIYYLLTGEELNYKP
jgi:hypothetical protein